jgi:membrane associated rhomboid family serine protease
MTAPEKDLDPGQETPPTCFRHPSRETWVSCVRCGRHACPDCLRQAAVGQQCVECVRGGRTGSRQARTVFGGRPAASSAVTWAIMAVNVVVFLAEVVKPSLLYDLSMLSTSVLSPAGPLTGVAGGAWYRLITSAFTAPGASFGGLGLLDLALNMWCLYIIGPQLERLFGPVRYLAIYLVSAAGGSVLYYYLAPANQLAAGASGAIFGLFAAWFVASKRLRTDSSGIVILIVVNLVFSFIWSVIAWQDHVGGLIAGALLSAAYAYAPRKNRALVQLAATVGMIAIIAVAVIIRTGQLTT